MGFLLDRKRRVLFGSCLLLSERRKRGRNKDTKINLKGEDYSPSFSQTEPLICLFIQKKLISDISGEALGLQ